MPKKLPLSEFKKIYSKVPRLCVDVVVQDGRGILLTKRIDSLSFGGMWHIPGGTVLFHETVEEAVKRIAKRELGLKVKIIKLLGFTELPYEKSLSGAHAVSLEFLVKVISGQVKLNNEASEFGFFKVPPAKTVKEHKEFLEKYNLV